MRGLALLLGLLLFSSEVPAQSGCQAPALTTGRTNIFTEQQEVDLGEITAENLAHSIRVIEDDALVAPLRRIGERVVRQMPESKLNYRFFLIDEATANAFAVPGGRVYVTRKLITATRSEDELAGVLAHEVGHQLNHDSAVVFTKAFKQWLNITSVGNREDIENKYHLLLDSYRKKDLRINADEDKAQLNADQVAMFAVARAGYVPQAVVEFWDRFTERKGRKGSWFSDMFGSTAPESKRLREFARTAGQLPSSCVDRAQAAPAADYANWKDAVLHYKGFGKKEAVPRLLTKKALDPPLQGELKHLRFSPNGRYLLGQDDASVFVLEREPLQVLFRIDARDALPAQFTPDSQFVVFHNDALRVHKWNIAGRSEAEVKDVYVFQGCLRSLLSPDGAVLACFRPDPDEFIPVGIRLIDVATGDVVFDKKNFIDASVSDGRAWYVYRYLILQGGPAFTMDFSTDGRYFLAGIGPHQFGYDMREKREMKLPSSVKAIMDYAFAFIGPDRVVGVDGDRGYDSKIVRVPTGEVLQSDLHIGPLAVQAATRGEFLIVRPLIETPAGLMDLKQNKIFLASKTDALDVYEGTWIAERASGEIALYRRPHIAPIATATLPRAPLGSLRAAVFSPDLNLLALSNRSRGKIWDLSGEGALNLGAFVGAYLDTSSAAIDFAPPSRFRKLRTRGVSEKDLRKEEGDKQGDTIARIDLVKPAMSEVAKYQKRQRTMQIGSTYVVLLAKDDEHPGRDITLEVRDFRSGQLLWTRFFKRMPSLGWNPEEDIVVFAWDLTDRAAKGEIKQDPEAARLAESILEKDESFFVAVLEARTGNTTARFPIDTGKGSFRIADVHPSGQYVLFLDNNNRVLIYNAKGQRVGRFFGRNPAVSSTSKLLAVEREPGRIAVFDLTTMAKREEITFDAPVEHAQFSSDGRRLAVLTEQQQVYVLDVSAPAPK